MQEFYTKSAKLCQLIATKLSKLNKYNIAEAETMQDFYDFAQAQAIRLQAIEKEVIFLRAIADKALEDAYSPSIKDEQTTIKELWQLDMNTETRQALKDWADATVLALKNQ